MLDAGATNFLIIGLDQIGNMNLDATLASYEEVHALLNRATYEVTVAHINFINARNSEQKAIENVDTTS